MSLEYKPSLGFVETAGLVIAIQVADAMAKAAEVEIISAHKVDGSGLFGSSAGVPGPPVRPPWKPAPCSPRASTA